MSKEKLLEEFIQLRIKIPYQNFNLSPSDFYKLENGFIVLQDFLSQAIDQTREETIREIEDGLPKEMEAFYTGNLMADVLENDEKKGFNKCLREIKQSLINLRSK